MTRSHLSHARTLPPTRIRDPVIFSPPRPPEIQSTNPKVDPVTGFRPPSSRVSPSLKPLAQSTFPIQKTHSENLQINLSPPASPKIYFPRIAALPHTQNFAFLTRMTQSRVALFSPYRPQARVNGMREAQTH
jgi:hypothetical protein